MGDLLVCEHLAGEAINADKPGWAAQSSVHMQGGRMWLLSRRSDRTAAGGRVGWVSPEAMDGQLTGVDPRRAQGKLALRPPLRVGLAHLVAPTCSTGLTQGRAAHTRANVYRPAGLRQDGLQ